MAEYINRKALMRNLKKFAPEHLTPLIESLIRKQPSADVTEVRHGEWLSLVECANEGVYCSNCHKKVYKVDYANQKLKSKFCPNCGAKMDGKVGYNT